MGYLFQWRTGGLLALALGLRLVLAPCPGFVGDANVMVQYARVTTQQGLFAVSDIPTTELWPPGFVYHAWLAGRLLDGKLGDSRTIAFGETTAIERLGVRIFPILYDVAVGAILMFVLGRRVSPSAGAWGAALYWFNPGTIANAALWNYDAMSSLFLLAAVVFLGAALRDGRIGLWVLAWSAAGLAFCSKLQTGELLPVLGLMTLSAGRWRALWLGAFAFVTVTAAVYAPFLAGHQWIYLRRVFVDSFQSYPVTHVNSYNLWGLWFQMPVEDRLAGVTLETIGRLLYLGALGWLAWQVWRLRAAQTGSGNGLRRAAVVSAYGCLAPFILLTRMHERYLAPAVAVCVLAGLLDRRLQLLMWGISATYALNLLAILAQTCWHPAGSAAELKGIHLGFCGIRFGCSLLNVGLFLWLARRLPQWISGQTPRLATPSGVR